MKALPSTLAAFVQKSAAQAVDWLMIALNFSFLLRIAGRVVREGLKTATNYFLAGSGTKGGVALARPCLGLRAL